MSFLNKILKTFIGDKNQKDLAEINKIIPLIKAEEAKMSTLTIDEIREKTQSFKNQIKEATAHIQKEIDDYKSKIEATTDFDLQDTYYEAIDKLEDDSYEIEQKVLSDIPIEEKSYPMYVNFMNIA
jgi:preprotein translocase subunit SecA